jgi:hypothetical protein
MEARQRTVGHLQQLYTVVTGVALTLAITKLLDEKAPMPLRIDVIPYFLAYLVTLVPFYHGALRHLDITYFEDAQAKTKPGALMFDWTLLFLESCFLLALALLLQSPKPFGFALCALLGFDCIWAFIACLAFSPETKEHRAEWKWAFINLAAVFLLLVMLLYIESLDAALKPVETFRWVVILLVAVVRTICDYAWNWTYYYPPIGSRSLR